MSIKRFDADRIVESLGEGEFVTYEDHLVEVARLLHIIAALEGQLKAESEQIRDLKKKLFLCDNIVFELSQE